MGFLSADRRLASGRLSGEISRLFNLGETITSGLDAIDPGTFIPVLLWDSTYDGLSGASSVWPRVLSVLSSPSCKLWRIMDWRMRLFSYLFAVLCGVLISRLWLSESTEPVVETPSQQSSQTEIVELRARLLSEQSLRRQLEGRVAQLKAARLLQETSALQAQVEEEALVEVVPAIANPAVEANPFDAIQQQQKFDRALSEGGFLAIFEELSEGVAGGNIDGAIEQLQILDQAFAAPVGEGPFAGLEPFYDDMMGYWLPQVLASCQVAGDEWLQLFVRAREMEWEGIPTGPLLQTFLIDEFLALAVFSMEEISESTGALLLDHLSQSFVEKGRLSPQELATLSRLPGERAVRLLEQVWESGALHREAALSALIQAHHPSAEAVLRRILPRVEDLKLRSALEIWLNR